MNPIVELIDVSKSFPGVAALAGVSLTLRPGRIHALVGENGAGKSTLLNVLAGALAPDSGEVRLDGKPVHFASVRDARRAGVVMVHQEVDLFAELSVAENVGLLVGLPVNALGWVNWREQGRRTREALDAVHERVDLRTPAANLSPAQRQMVEIAAAVSQSARVLILDEPTSSLSAAEAQTLFAHLRRFRERGTAIVYVSHRLEEIFALTDEVTVLRDGRRVWHGPVGATSHADLIRKMVGRDVGERPSLRSPSPLSEDGGDKLGRSPSSVRFRCESVSDEGGACADISLEVRGGEVLALYGLIGAGRSEWAQVLLGLRPGTGRIWIDGKPACSSGPAALAKRGLVYVPEDRLRQGLCRGLSVRANAALASLRQIAVGLFLPGWRESRLGRDVVRRMAVKAVSVEQPIGTLSGGNQQKVVLGRWLARDPGVLVLDEPTRGVDVGAKDEIHADIRRLADAGKAVVLISSDLPEVLAHGDRIGVFREGRLAKVFASGATAEEVAEAALPTEEASGGRKPPDPSIAQGASRHQGTENQGASRHQGAYAPRSPDWVARLPRELALLTLVVLLALGLEAKTRHFLTGPTLGSLMSDSVLLGCVAAGAGLVILAGGIDISLGSLMALSAAVAGTLWQHGTPWPAVLAVALLVGAGGGALNAGLAHVGRIHPIVVTLGTMSVYRGLTRWWMKQDIQIPGAVRNVLFGEGQAAPRVVWLGAGLFVLLAVLLNRTALGRSLFAVGGNPAAARKVGISPARVWLKAYTLQGALAGLAGILFLARSGSLQTTSYEDKTLQAISAAVVGGVAITGGRGSIPGVLLGCVLLVLLTMACQFLDISTDWQQAAVGSVLVVAVTVDALWRRRS